MTKEYISRDEMIEQTKARIVLGAPKFNTGLEAAIEVATSIPAADVVEVVRCGQCKYCVEHYDTDGNAPYWTCKEWDSGTDYDGYCHYGERKEGGQDGV